LGIRQPGREVLLVVLKIDSAEKIAALMESIHGSIHSEAARPQLVDRNASKHDSDGQSGRG
jgi:hypothetical protein